LAIYDYFTERPSRPRPAAHPYVKQEVVQLRDSTPHMPCNPPAQCKIQCGVYGTMFRQAQLKLINPYALTPTLSIERFHRSPFLLFTFYLCSPYAPHAFGSLVISCSSTPTPPRDSVNIAPSITFTVSFASLASPWAHGAIHCREADFWSPGSPVYFVGK
jgi:hypothetical protein